jgi:hypothetical protein
MKPMDFYPIGMKKMMINDCKSSSWTLTYELFETTSKKLVETFNFALKEPPSSVQN